MLIALTRQVPPSITRCELTHLAREPIDWERASHQHERYESVLTSLGCSVQRLPELPDHPDSVFVEDTAIVLDECAIITRPGAASRRGETDSVAHALRSHRELHFVRESGTLDGGDVLRVGRTLYVGLSTRTNAEGARQLADAIARYGYRVDTISVRGSLHLKSLASALPDDRVLVYSSKLDAAAFAGAGCIEVPGGEEIGANVLSVGGTIVCPAAAPRTRALLEAEGYRVVAVDASELAKAEGALTCCSLILRKS
jgi:dimethylargininase